MAAPGRTPPPHGSIRLATASPASNATRTETLDQLTKLAQRAAHEKVDILLLPEAYIGGYPRGTAFGASVGGRTHEGRDEYLQYFSQAVDLGDTVNDGAGEGDAWTARRDIERLQQAAGGGDEGGTKTPQVVGDGTREELEAIASNTGVFLVTGLIERVGGSLYCAVVYVCPKLGMVGKRRKVMPTGIERLIWAQGSPATLKAITTVIRGVRINLAAAICWENYMPLLRQSLYAQNVNLYLAPTADTRNTWAPLMQTIGIEGRCFVVSSNMCIRKKVTSCEDSDSHKTTRQIVTDEYDNEIVLPTTTINPGQQLVVEKEPHVAEVIKDEDETVTPSNNKGDNLVNMDKKSTAAISTEKVVQAMPLSTEEPPLTEESKEFDSRGGSCIVSPFGDVIAGPQWEDADGIIYADVDFQECIRGRLDLDVAGSYSRNDSFKFSVEGLDLKPLPYY